MGLELNDVSFPELHLGDSMFSLRVQVPLLERALEVNWVFRLQANFIVLLRAEVVFQVWKVRFHDEGRKDSVEGRGHLVVHFSGLPQNVVSQREWGASNSLVEQLEQLVVDIVFVESHLHVSLEILRVWENGLNISQWTGEDIRPLVFKAIDHLSDNVIFTFDPQLLTQRSVDQFVSGQSFHVYFFQCAVNCLLHDSFPWIFSLPEFGLKSVFDRIFKLMSLEKRKVSESLDRNVIVIDFENDI